MKKNMDSLIPVDVTGPGNEIMHVLAEALVHFYSKHKRTVDIASGCFAIRIMSAFRAFENSGNVEDFKVELSKYFKSLTKK